VRSSPGREKALGLYSPFFFFGDLHVERFFDQPARRTSIVFCRCFNAFLFFSGYDYLVEEPF
jgi:hypothetical protein